MEAEVEAASYSQGRGGGCGHFRTSASTWRPAFCCSQEAAPRGLRRGRERDGLHTDLMVIQTDGGLRRQTDRQQPRRDTCRRCIWCRCRAPSSGSQPAGEQGEASTSIPLKVVSVILGPNINDPINLISPPDPLAARLISRT